MSDQPFKDVIPPEMRAFAEQSVQQARKAFDDLMEATQRAISTFEGHATTAQSSARDLQRKIVGFAESNVAASLEFAQKLMKAKTPTDLMALHSEYAQQQMKVLTEQAGEIAQHAAKAAKLDGTG